MADLKNIAKKAVNSFDRQIKVINVEPYDSGYARSTLKIETERENNLVVYLCTDTSDKYERRFSIEEKLIEIVNKKTSIPTQNIVHSDFSKKKIKYFFYVAEEVKGFNPIDRYYFLPRKVKKNIICDFGSYLAELHKNLQFKNSGHLKLTGGSIETINQEFSNYLKEWSMNYIEQLEDTRYEDIQKDYKKFLLSNLGLADTDLSCCLHWDNSPDNLIINKGSINAVIDWEKAISGTPEWDLAIARTGLITSWFKSREVKEELDKALFRSYKEKRRLNNDWKRRVIYFQTLHSLMNMANTAEAHSGNMPVKGYQGEKYYRGNFKKAFKSLGEFSREEIKTE